MKRIWLLYSLSFAFASAAGCAEDPQPPRVIKVVTKKYTVEPAEIRVKKGENIQLQVSTPDVQHGFEVPELGISEPVQPNKPAVFALKTDRTGTFEIKCGIICGARHDEMRGKLIIE